MPRSRSEPGNESHQNEAGRSILTFKFGFVLVSKATQQKAKQGSLLNELVLPPFDLPTSF